MGAMSAFLSQKFSLSRNRITGILSKFIIPFKKSREVRNRNNFHLDQKPPVLFCFITKNIKILSMIWLVIIRGVIINKIIHLCYSFLSSIFSNVLIFSFEFLTNVVFKVSVNQSISDVNKSACSI